MLPTIREIDQLVENLLSKSQVEGPPFNAAHIAQRLGIDVIRDNRQEGRARQKVLRGQPTIFVRMEDRDERFQWSVAHELGEIHGSDLLSRVIGNDANEATTWAYREQLANEIGTRVLLPEPHFSQLAQKFQADITELKRVFSTASYEQITRRLLSIGLLLVISQFDQGRLVRRTSSQGPVLQKLTPVEKSCWEQIHHGEEFCEERTESMWIRGYAIHEPEWKREFLLTMPLDGFAL